MEVCVVCRCSGQAGNSHMCDPCGRSFDRVVARENTEWATLEWAARRAWRFAKKRYAKRGAR